jgi:hypothetical protein
MVILHDGADIRGRLSWLPDMAATVGELTMITHALGSGFFTLNNSAFTFTREWLEKVS